MTENTVGTQGDGFKEQLLANKTPEQINADIAALEAANREKIDELAEVVDQAELKAAQERLGIDLTFDPKAFIQLGTVSKKGVPVFDGYYVDIHSISSEERLIAENMVAQVYGTNLAPNVYRGAMESAIVAMAISRVNKELYPSPSSLLYEKSKTDTLAYRRKLELFQSICGMGDAYRMGIVVLYDNLRVAADILIADEATRKK